MAKVNDPALREAYDDVRNDDTETNCKKIVLHGKGSNGLEELKESLDPTKIMYCFVRFIVGDEESRRAKFVFLTWIGESASVLAKARVSVHTPSVRTVIRDFSVGMHATELEEIEEAAIQKAIIKAMGANYSGNSKSI